MQASSPKVLWFPAAPHPPQHHAVRGMGQTHNPGLGHMHLPEHGGLYRVACGSLGRAKVPCAHKDSKTVQLLATCQDLGSPKLSSMALSHQHSDTTDLTLTLGSPHRPDPGTGSL